MKSWSDVNAKWCNNWAGQKQKLQIFFFLRTPFVGSQQSLTWYTSDTILLTPSLSIKLNMYFFCLLAVMFITGARKGTLLCGTRYLLAVYFPELPLLLFLSTLSSFFLQDVIQWSFLLNFKLFVQIRNRMCLDFTSNVHPINTVQESQFHVNTIIKLV